MKYATYKILSGIVLLFGGIFAALDVLKYGLLSMAITFLLIFIISSRFIATKLTPEDQEYTKAEKKIILVLNIACVVATIGIIFLTIRNILHIRLPIF